MKEQLDGKLVEILASIQGAVGKASDFAIAELPDIAQSYIAYGRASLTLWVVIGAALLLAVPWLTRRCIANVIAAGKASYEEEARYGATAILQGGGAALATLIGGITLFGNLGAAMLVWLAPKVWLLKEIAGMLK